MSVVNQFSLNSEVDGLALSVCTVLPEGKPRGLVQFAHGMAEHKMRYLPFMQFLADHGYACIINDHRGHGGSVRSKDDLGYFYAGGACALVEDLHQLTLWFKGQYPGIPLILFGHSMGSLAVRVYRQRYDGDIDALVVCGSPGRNPAAGAGLLLNRLMTLFKGERYISRMFVNMTTGAFSKAHPSPDTPNAWLSTNQDNVQRYDADPLCGFPFTLNGYRALLELMRDAYAAVPAAHPELPIHFISGAQDPCAPDEKGFEDAVGNLRSAGYTRVSSKLYPGMRHEILNHAEHQLVYDDLLRLFDGWVRPAGAR
ncbi:MAG: alpha/beta fold hydrolase [Clostridia bacterium]|nr:alpha/beta fold hydrolase [Clostridia bacterium]